jgi:hypothetical protein
VSLSPGGHDEDIPQQISYLAQTAHGIEDRLLHLVKEIARGAVPLEDFISELAFLAKDLQRCFRRVVDMKERRDLGFATLRDLGVVESHCVWLHRKIRLEQAFFRKLHAETKLRSMLSAEAFEVYQELLDAEDQEREFLRKGDAEVRKELLGERCSLPPESR